MTEKLRIPEVTEKLLQEIVEWIVWTVEPEQIILFGSRARSDSGPRSDVDILVIMESTEPRHGRLIPLLAALSDIIIPMGILVYTPEEVREWSNVPQAFPTTAVREGRVLYEKEN